MTVTTESRTMTKAQMARVAAVILESQGRTAHDEDDIVPWALALQDLPYSLVMEAVQAVIREVDDFVKPATVRRRAMDIARQRVQAAGAPDPPAGLSQVEYSTWQDAYRWEVIMGKSRDEAGDVALRQIGAPTGTQMLGHSVPTLALNSPSGGQVGGDVVDAEVVEEDESDGGPALPPVF